VSHIGSHYHVYYKEDGDQEYLSEHELEDLYFIVPDLPVADVDDDSCDKNVKTSDDSNDPLDRKMSAIECNDDTFDCSNGDLDRKMPGK
jgi:hypothetical protein